MPARTLAAPLRLTPAAPRVGNAFLTFHEPVMVEAGPVQWSGNSSLPTDGYALFSSKFADIVGPSLQVEFEPDDPGLKYLVEIYITTIQSSTYQFRVLRSPGTHQDISFTSSKVITAVFDPTPNWLGAYNATFRQLNPSSQLMSWYFHDAFITAVENQA